MRVASRLAILVALAILLAGSISIASIPASAATTTTFTTTSDFDNGTKTQIPNFHFVSNAGVRGINDAGGPTAIYANGRTYVTYQAFAGTNKNDPYVTYYDHSTKTWATPQDAGDNPQVTDGHGSPCIVRDSTGRLHVFFGAHTSTLLHRATVNPDDITSWTDKTTIGGVVTYCHVLTIGTNMYVIYRVGFSGAPGGTIRYRVSTNDGASFGNEATILDPGVDQSFYVGPATALFGTKFHMVGVWATPSLRRYNAYEFYLDLSNGHMFGEGGIDLGVTATLTELNTSARVEITYPTGDAVAGVVHLDASGNPYLIYSVNTTTGLWRYKFSRWTGSAWTSPTTIVSIGLGNDGAEYTVRSSTSIEAYLTLPGDQPDEYGGDMQRWVYDGSTWSYVETILTESYTAAAGLFGAPPHNRPVMLNVPFVPVDYNDEIRVLFEEFIGDNYVIGTLRLYAWGANGFVPIAGTQGGSSVETISDDSNVASGSFALASGRGETFATSDSDANNWKWNPGSFTSGTAGTINRERFENGKLVLNTSASAYWEIGLVGGFTVSSPDISINTNRVYKSGSNGDWGGLALFNQRQSDCRTDGASGTGAPGTIDGVFIRKYGNDVGSFTCADGLWVQKGSTTTISATNQICFRIENTTTQWKTYYSTSSTCATWTLDETFTFIVPRRMYPVLFEGIDNGGVATTINRTYDDFVLRSGTVGLGGYVRSGSWTSPTIVVPSSEVVARVSLSFSGVSSSRYIDRVELLSGSTVVETYETNIVSGTSRSIAFQATTGNVHVRVTLAGDGAGSPIVTSVSATTGAASVAQLGYAVDLVTIVIVAMIPLVIVVSIFGLVSRVFQRLGSTVGRTGGKKT